MHRWRTQQAAIRNVNCRIQWIIESLNANGVSGKPLACLSECHFSPILLILLVFRNRWQKKAELRFVTRVYHLIDSLRPLKQSWLFFSASFLQQKKKDTMLTFFCWNTRGKKGLWSFFLFFLYPEFHMLSIEEKLVFSIQPIHVSTKGGEKKR